MPDLQAPLLPRRGVVFFLSRSRRCRRGNRSPRTANLDGDTEGISLAPSWLGRTLLDPPSILRLCIPRARLHRIIFSFQSMAQRGFAIFTRPHTIDHTLYFTCLFSSSLFRLRPAYSWKRAQEQRKGEQGAVRGGKGYSFYLLISIHDDARDKGRKERGTCCFLFSCNFPACIFFTLFQMSGVYFFLHYLCLALPTIYPSILSYLHPAYYLLLLLVM